MYDVSLTDKKAVQLNRETMENGLLTIQRSRLGKFEIWDLQFMLFWNSSGRCFYVIKYECGGSIGLEDTQQETIAQLMKRVGMPPGVCQKN